MARPNLLKTILLIVSLSKSLLLHGDTKKNVATQVTIDITRPSENTPITQANPITVTVLIHGSRFFKPLDAFAYCPAGLHHISMLPDYYRFNRIAQTLADTDPEKFSMQHTFAFGWPGSLSFEVREQAAQQLSRELETLSRMYEECYHQRPNFRLISHSHGGNVILNMAKFKPEDDWITISEVVLLACPVQTETAQLIKSPLFKNVLSLYSAGDLTQTLDPQGLYRTPHNQNRHLEFSDRRFDEHPTLVQASITCNNRSLFHIEFLMNHFFEALPTIMDKTHRLKRNKIYNAEDEIFVTFNIQ